MQFAVLFFGYFVVVFKVLDPVLKNNKDRIIEQYHNRFITEDGIEFVLELTRGFAGIIHPQSLPNLFSIFSITLFSSYTYSIVDIYSFVHVHT